jgi:hypothetical protein
MQGKKLLVLNSLSLPMEYPRRSDTGSYTQWALLGLQGVNDFGKKRSSMTAMNSLRSLRDRLDLFLVAIWFSWK